MRNFLQIASGVDTLPLLHGIQRQPELWNRDKLRTTHKASPHTQVDDILLRFIDLSYATRNEDGTYTENPASRKHVADQHESVFYPAWFALPQVGPIVFDLMRRIEGVRLGRVIITRLAPGKVISPHEDSGDHAEYFDRYHCILQNQPGSIFRTGNEIVTMRPGDVYWFNNAVEHEVQNNSADDRITMIIDIRTIR